MLSEEGALALLHELLRKPGLDAAAIPRVWGELLGAVARPAAPPPAKPKPRKRRAVERVTLVETLPLEPKHLEIEVVVPAQPGPSSARADGSEAPIPVSMVGRTRETAACAECRHARPVHGGWRCQSVGAGACAPFSAVPLFLEAR